MRIIHGRLKGLRFPAYHGSNTRPTTDLVKESLFNSLSAYIDLEGVHVIDLFAGTGNIGLEFLSRGAQSLVSVEHYAKNIDYMKKVRKENSIEEWEITKSDVFKYLNQGIPEGADLIFADPPYDLTGIHDLVNKITDSDWFKSPGKLFVLEHTDRLVFNNNHVFLKKQYGNTSFTGFTYQNANE